MKTKSVHLERSVDAFGKLAYTVIKAVNVMSPYAGEVLTEREAERLVSSRSIKVTIVPAKQK